MWKSIAFVGLLLCPSLLAQNDDRNQLIQQSSSLYQKGSDYRLGTGDLIEVSVFGVNNFRHELRINSSGTVDVPLLNVVPVAGLTATEVKQKLETLLDGELIRNPQVSVFIKEYRSQPVYILGAVSRPGQYQITQSLNLIDVLSMAGGLQPNAGDEAIIQRPLAQSTNSSTAEKNPGGSDIIKISLNDLLKKNQLPLNVPVQGGDVIHIAERVMKVFYVVGEVTRPGSFQLPIEQDFSLTRAIALAGGPARTAKLSKGILVRFDEQGTRQQMPVDFSAILKGKRTDFAIRPDDIIFIPGSTIKEIGYGLLGNIPNTISRVPYIIR